MARKRWRGVSRKQRSEAMRKLALKRWRTRTVQGEADGGAVLERLISLRFPPDKRAAQIARALAALKRGPFIRADKDLWKWAAETDFEDSF
jgi:hypothetical protein